METEVKKSRFVAFAWPVSHADDAMALFASQRDPAASHNCFAYKGAHGGRVWAGRAGPAEHASLAAAAVEPPCLRPARCAAVGQHYRSSDDGEPGGTAGRPILAAIEGEGLDGVAVLVTRCAGPAVVGHKGTAALAAAAALARTSSSCTSSSP